MLWKAPAWTAAVLAVVIVQASVIAQAPTVDGIWISRTDLLALPTSGPSWDYLVARAGETCPVPDLTNQDDMANVCVMAKALVAARTGNAALRNDVVDALAVIADGGPYVGRALSLGRELAAYVIAADLIELRALDPALDQRFRDRLRVLLTTPTIDGPASLVQCHEERPNNWGAHCGASRIAVAIYLNDQTELSRAVEVFKGYLGDRDAYSAFSYGDLSWQCDAAFPVPINPLGCLKEGHSVDGVVPDDQRRSGPFVWPPPQENYVYESMQGALAQAIMLERAGYPVFEWQSRALLRVFEWLYQEANYPADGEDIWEMHVINHFYSTSFPAEVPARPGKNVGWTDWTHPPTATPPPPPPPPPPTAPASLHATALTYNLVQLDWTDTSATETAFHVERADSSGVFAEIGTVPGDVASFLDPTVDGSTAYSYRVRASNDTGFSEFTAVGVVTTPEAPAIIKAMTFEGGSLKNAVTGADATSGKVALEAAAPLKGSYAARMIGKSMYVEERITPTADFYLSVYVRLGALPTSDARIIQIMNSGSTIGNILLRPSGRLRLRTNSTNIGVESAPLVPGQLYRIGIHQRAGSGANAVLEAFVASGDAAFAAAFSQTTAGAWKTSADKIRLGATTGSVNLVLDDGIFSTAAMAGPSN